MMKIIKLILILLISLSLTNFVSAEDSFFEEAKKNMIKKDMKNRNFYFKEI